MRSFLLMLAFVLIFFAVPRIMRAEEIQFETEDGVFILGSSFPAGHSPAPAVILMHMLRKDRSSWLDFIPAFNKAGFTVLTFDFRGHGQSKRSLKGSVSEPGLSEANSASLYKYDLKAAVHWLRNLPGIIPGKIVLIGASIGANVAINYAVEDSLIAAVVLISPGIIYRGIALKPALQAYLPRSVMFIAAEDDNYSAVTVKESAPLLRENIAVTLLEDGGHGTYLLQSRPELISMVLEYLRVIIR